MAQMAKRRHLNQDRFSRTIITAAAATIVILGARFIASDLIAPLLLLFFLTTLLQPLFKWFRHFGLPSGISIALMVVTLIVGVVGIVFFTTWSFEIFAKSISSYTESLSQLLSTIGFRQGTSDEIAQSINPEEIVKVALAVLGNMRYLTLYFFIIPLLSILLLLQIDSTPPEFINNFTEKTEVGSKMKRMSESMVRYVGGRLKVNIITGVVFTIALLVLQIEYPSLWGFMTIILGFVPYIALS